MQWQGAILVRLFYLFGLSCQRMRCHVSRCAVMSADTGELLTNRALVAPAAGISQQLVHDGHFGSQIQRDGSTLDVGEAPPSLIRV